MTFLHFWAIGIGAATLAAPLAIHFLTKPRPQSMPLSTLRFLKEVLQQRRARSRFRDLLVLLLRTLAIALLSLALARPFFEDKTAIDPTVLGAVSRVILLDISLSMDTSVAGASVWNRAQAAALRYVDYSPGLQAEVIFVGARPRNVFGRLSSNLEALRESIKKNSVRSERADVRAAIEQAGRTLQSASKSARSELIVISDFQRSNWGSLFLEEIPESTKVQLESVAMSDTDNVGITGVRTASRPVAGRPFLVEVDIANHTDRISEVRCNAELGSQKFQLAGSVLPRTTGTITKQVAIADPGWCTGWVSLESNLDVLSSDDERPIAFEIYAPPRVCLISRQLPSQVPSSSFFLNQAMNLAIGASEQQEDSQSSVVRLSTDNLDAANLPAAELYVVDHAGTMNDDTLELLAQRVRRGKSLLWVASSLADGVAIERLTSKLGVGFQPPVQLASPRDGFIRKDLFITSTRNREPPFAIFGDSTSSILGTVRIGGGLDTRTTREGLQDQLLATLSDSSALLYITPCDAGQVAVFNLDLEKSNWYREQSFVPVISELLQRLLSSHSPTNESFCGEPIVRILPSNLTADSTLDIRNKDVRSPSSEDYGKWEWSESQSATIWTWPDPVGAGIYQVNSSGKEVAAVATCAPALESDLATLEQTTLQGRISGTRPVGFRTADDEDNKDDSLWNWLIVACVLGMLSEVAALRWFRS
jgi:Aerotolerance regulator N-terminal/von Willebrand factor type A domain